MSMPVRMGLVFAGIIVVGLATAVFGALHTRFTQSPDNPQACLPVGNGRQRNGVGHGPGRGTKLTRSLHFNVFPFV